MDYEIVPILEDIAMSLEKIEKHLGHLTKEIEKRSDHAEPDKDKGGQDDF